MKRTLFVVCIFITLLSCGPSRKALDAKEDELLNQWLKQPRSQLVRQWGRPDSIISDGRNGQIFIYKEGIDYVSVMNEKYTGPQYSFRKEMYINADSLIYYWRVWRRK